jgi:hypothetical protein
LTFDKLTKTGNDLVVVVSHEVCKIFINKNNCLINFKNLPFMIAIFISIFSWIIRLWLNCDENLEQIIFE